MVIDKTDTSNYPGVMMSNDIERERYAINTLTICGLDIGVYEVVLGNRRINRI